MTFNEVHRAIKRGDLVALQRVLENGLDPNLHNRYFVTILMLAAAKGNTAIGKLLIAKGADPNARDMHGNTPLSDAIQSGHTSFVKLLLDSGASLNCSPHGTSLEVFLNWVERYCAIPKESIENIKELFISAHKSSQEEMT